MFRAARHTKYLRIPFFPLCLARQGFRGSFATDDDRDPLERSWVSDSLFSTKDGRTLLTAVVHRGLFDLNYLFSYENEQVLVVGVEPLVYCLACKKKGSYNAVNLALRRTSIAVVGHSSETPRSVIKKAIRSLVKT